MKFTLYLISLLLVANGYSQSAFVNAKLDTSYILVGDQIQLTLSAEHQLNTKVAFPELKDTVGKIVIVSSQQPDTIKSNNDLIRVSRKYTITCFDSGDYAISGLPFLIVKETSVDTVFTNSVYLTVRNAEAPKGQEPIYDIKSVLKVPFTFIEIMTYIGIVLLVVMLIGLIMYFIIQRKQNRPFFKIEKPTEPPHIIAFRELENTKSDKLWQQGQIKQYYSRLSEIIKTYIEHRYNILAVESTTDEVLEFFKGKDDKIFKQLEALLRESDLVKFAKAEPLPNENEEAWSLAYDFVYITKNEEIAEAKSENE